MLTCNGFIVIFQLMNKCILNFLVLICSVKNLIDITLSTPPLTHTQSSLGSLIIFKNVKES